MVEPASLLQELLNDFHPEKNNNYTTVKTSPVKAYKRRASNFLSGLITPDSSPQKSDKTPEDQAQSPDENRLEKLNKQIKKNTRDSNGQPRQDCFSNLVLITRQEAESFRKNDSTLAAVKTDPEFKLLTVTHLVNLFKGYQRTAPEDSVTPADVIMSALESARAEALDLKLKKQTKKAIPEAQKPVEENKITDQQVAAIIDNLCNNFKLPSEITETELAKLPADNNELSSYLENYQDYIELNTLVFKQTYLQKLRHNLEAQANRLLEQNQYNLEKLAKDLTSASIDFRNQEFNDLRNFIDNKILDIDSVVSQPEQDTESEALKNNPELTFVLAIKNRLNWHIDISKFDYPLATKTNNISKNEQANQLAHIRHTYDAFEEFLDQNPNFLTNTLPNELTNLLSKIIPMCAKLVDACAKLGKPDCHLKASMIDQLITIIKYESQSTKAAESITANTPIETKEQALIYARKILCSQLHDNYAGFTLLPSQAKRADYLQTTLADQSAILSTKTHVDQQKYPDVYRTLENLSYADIFDPALTAELFTQESKPAPKIKKSSEDYQVYYEEKINGSAMVHHAMSASLKAKRFVKSSSRFSQRPNLLLAAKLDFIHRINQEKEKLRQQAQNKAIQKTNTALEATEEKKESHNTDGIKQDQLPSQKDGMQLLPDREKTLDRSDTITTASMTTITTTITTKRNQSSNSHRIDDNTEAQAEMNEHKAIYLTSDKLLELFYETKQHLSSDERQLPDSFPKDYRELLAAPRNASLFTWPRIRWTESEAVAPMLLDQASLEAELDYYQHLFNLLPGSKSINQETGKILSAKEMIQDYFNNNTVSFKNYILCAKLLFMSLAAKQQDNTQTSEGLASLFNMVKGQMANFNQTSKGATKLTQHYGHLFGTIQSAGLANNHKELLATHRNFFKRVMLGKKLKTKGSKQTKAKILSQDKLQAKLDELMLELDKLPDVDPRDSLNKKIETVLLDSKKAPSFKHYILCMKTYFLHESATYEPTPAEINEQNARPTEHNFQTRLNARLQETVEHFQKKFTLPSEYQETIQAAETQEIVSEGTASSAPDDSHNKEAMNKFHQNVFKNQHMHEYTHFMTLGTGYFSGFGGHFRISKKGTEATRVLNEYQPSKTLTQATVN